MTARDQPRRIAQDVNREVARIRRTQVVKPGPTCRVCSDPDARRRVNTQLGIGIAVAEIERSLEDINAKRRKNQQITYSGIRWHRDHHFDVQEPLKAAQRRMLEARAAEEDLDILSESVRSILTARGMLELAAQKSMEHLTDPNTVVPYELGIQYRIQLEKMIAADADAAERAKMRRDVALIQQAIREEFSDEQMRRLAKRIDILRGVAQEEDTVIDGEVIDDQVEYDDVASLDTSDVDEEDTLE